MDRVINLNINIYFDKDNRVALDTNVRGDVDTGDEQAEPYKSEDEHERRRLLG